MTLRHNDKVVFDLPASDGLIDRLQMFYGKSLTDHLIWVESEVGEVRMSGYVAHPSQSKSGRKWQHLFLNGRWFQDRSIQHALTESYRGLLMVGRQPISFIFVDMPPSAFDVNVHPTKVEVRFVDGQQLYRQMLSMIRTKFLTMDLDSEMKLGRGRAADEENLREPVGASVAPQQKLQAELEEWATDSGTVPAKRSDFQNSAPPITTWSVRQSQADLARMLAPSSQQRDAPEADAPEADVAFAEEASLPETVEAAEEMFVGREDGQVLGDQAETSEAVTDESTPNGGEATVDYGGKPAPAVGDESGERAMQIMDCYLVVEAEQGMMIIDQHALHERIMYEYLRPRVLNGSVESQRMLSPETIDLTAREASLVVEHAEVLGQIGIGVEEFGTNTVLVNKWPVMMMKARPAEMIRDIAEQLESQEKKPTRRDVLDELLHMMSCKAAIKSGQRLKPEEIDSLLAQRHLCDDAHHCPHGRPTALVLSQGELDKQFGRLG